MTLDDDISKSLENVSTKLGDLLHCRVIIGDDPQARNTHNTHATHRALKSYSHKSFCI